MTVLKDRNLILLLCVFLPFTYIAGILITEISVLILTIYFLFKNKNLKFFQSKEIIAFIIFSFYIAIIAILKIEHNDLKISSIFYIRFILFPLLPSGNFFNNWISLMLFNYLGFCLYSYNIVKKNG